MRAWDFPSTIWRWRGDSATWFFLTVPDDVSDDIEAQSPSVGFGSVRVEVTIGRTTWRTSVFPSKEQAAYVLPVKKAVRSAEDLDDDSAVEVHLALVD